MRVRLAKWLKGRQGTGYEKLCILQIGKIDVYLIRYREGDYVDWHVDPAPEGRKHHRVNIFLKKAEMGGRLIYKKSIKKFWRGLYFRPDINPHCVTPVLKGSRLILSIGWLT